MPVAMSEEQTTVDKSPYQGTRCVYRSLPCATRVALCMFGILSSVILPTGDGQVIGLNVILDQTPNYKLNGLSCHLKDLGLWATVDTGASALQFTLKQWYEHVMGPGSCGNFFAGCYTCKTACNPERAERYVVAFQDGARCEVFEHQENLRIGSVDVGEIKFRLTIGQDPPPNRHPAINLMGLERARHRSLPPLLYQLVDKRIISRKTFAIYLNQRAPSANVFYGQLLLGGGDPKRYKDPLLFLKFTDDAKYMVPLNSIQVGKLHYTFNQNIQLDTGSNVLVVPSLYFDGIMKAISQAASGSVVWDPESNLWTIACTCYPLMPTLILNLGPKGEVPIYMSKLSYVRPDAKGQRCGIMIFKQNINYWILPGSALITYYFEFQIDNGQVGIARTAPPGTSFRQFNGSEFAGSPNYANLSI